VNIAVYHNLPSGGAKRALCELVRRLAVRHTVDVFTVSSAEHEFGDVRPYVRSHIEMKWQPVPMLPSPFGRLNPLVRLWNVWRLRSVLRRVAARIEAADYDIAFVHPCQFESAPSLLSYLQAVPTVYFCQEPPRLLYEDMPVRPYDRAQSRARSLVGAVDPIPRMHRQLLRLNDGRNVQHASMVLVNSRYMQDACLRIYGFEPTLCYLGTDVELFRPLKQAETAGVLSVGSLTRLKGFDFLIESLATIPAERRPTLTIASNFENAPERAYLETLAGRLGVRVKWVGHVSDHSLAELYRRAILTLYTPIREPFGLVPLESMACGTPVVAVRQGGTLETILDGHTGVLVERDAKVFGRAVDQLCRNPARLGELRQECRRYVLDHWSWDLAARRVEFLLEGCASASWDLQRSSGLERAS
jgi:glycosyltransferase involved in cell wall biosynthesis